MRLNHPKTDFLLGLLFILVMCTGIGLASEIHVYSGLSIQDAVDNASSGDLIIVHSGLYCENIKVTKELTILSESGNPDNTIIKPENPNNSVFLLNSDNVKICGFTIKGAKIDNQSAVYLNNVRGNVLFNNNISDNNYGIYLYESTDNQIGNNYITNNKEGIYLAKSNKNILSKNVVSKNSNNGIYLSETENNTLLENVAFENHCGTKLEKSEKNKIIGNIEYNNIESNNVEEIIPYETVNGGTVLYESSNNVLSENRADYIALNSSNNNTLIKNTVNSDVYLTYSSNNTLTENNASITLEYSNGNLLRENNASLRVIGITILKSGYNIIESNNISSNKIYGIHLKSSKNNVIFNNNLSNNFKGIYRNLRENKIYSNFIEDKYSLQKILKDLIFAITTSILLYISYQKYRNHIKMLLEKHFEAIITVGIITFFMGINEYFNAYLMIIEHLHQLINSLVKPLSGTPIWNKTLILPSLCMLELMQLTDPFIAGITVLLIILLSKYIIECYYQVYKLDSSLKCCLKQLILFSPFVISWSTLFIVTYANIYIIMLSIVIYTLTIVLSNLLFIKFLAKRCNYKDEFAKKSKKYIFLKATFLSIWILVFFDTLLYALFMLLMWFIIYC